VDYSLFIMVAVLVILKRLEKRQEMAPTTFPPPIFAGSGSVSWIHVSPPPSYENTLRSLYIGVFRSSPSI
jgi:hypothetical protein